MLDLALTYASRGIPVFPVLVEEGYKRPLCHHGHRDATTNPDRLEETWPSRANAVGAYLGAIGWCAVDIDIKGDGDGFAQLQDVERQYGEIPADAPRVVTPSGGAHIWLAWPDGKPVGSRNGLGAACPSIDIKGIGGWVVVPGSAGYEWDGLDEPNLSVPLPQAPSWVAHAAPASPESERRAAPVDAEGPRNARAIAALERAGGRLVQRSPSGIYMCRPGKSAGVSASVGTTTPGGVVVFSSNWSALPAGTYSLEELEARIDEGLTANELVEAYVREANRPRLDGRFVTGYEFMKAGGKEATAIWGSGDDILWAEGQGLMLTGTQGTGKTTLAHQLVLERLGLGFGSLLDLSVTKSNRVLYLALDRPVQIAQSLMRFFTLDQLEEKRKVLTDDLVVMQGPIIREVVDRPQILAEWCEQVGADCVFIDSLKDYASPLSEESVATAVNQSYQQVIRNGVDLCVIHHQGKRGAGGGAPKALADVYGSLHLTAGLGSIVLLHGDAGDTEVELLHLKQPRAVVGPFTIRHDHHTGRTSRYTFNWRQAFKNHELITVLAFAQRMTGDYTPDKRTKQKAFEWLQRLVEGGELTLADEKDTYAWA